MSDENLNGLAPAIRPDEVANDKSARPAPKAP